MVVPITRGMNAWRKSLSVLAKHTCHVIWTAIFFSLFTLKPFREITNGTLDVWGVGATESVNRFKWIFFFSSLLFTHENLFKVCCYLFKCNFNRTHNQHTAHSKTKLFPNQRTKMLLTKFSFLETNTAQRKRMRIVYRKKKKSALCHTIAIKIKKKIYMKTLMRAWCGQMAKIAHHTHMQCQYTWTLENGSPKHLYRTRYDNTLYFIRYDQVRAFSHLTWNECDEYWLATWDEEEK